MDLSRIFSKTCKCDPHYELLYIIYKFTGVFSIVIGYTLSAMDYCPTFVYDKINRVSTVHTRLTSETHNRYLLCFNIKQKVIFLCKKDLLIYLY